MVRMKNSERWTNLVNPTDKLRTFFFRGSSVLSSSPSAGPCGALGEPWLPNTAHNSPQHFNNAVKTQLFSTSAASQAGKVSPSSLSSKSITSSSHLFPKNFLQSTSVFTWKIKAETPHATAFKLANGKVWRPLSARGKLVRLWVSEEIVISKSRWRLSNRAAVVSFSSHFIFTSHSFPRSHPFCPPSPFL